MRYTSPDSQKRQLFSPFIGIAGISNRGHRDASFSSARTQDSNRNQSQDENSTQPQGPQSNSVEYDEDELIFSKFQERSSSDSPGTRMKSNQNYSLFTRGLSSFGETEKTVRTAPRKPSKSLQRTRTRLTTHLKVVPEKVESIDEMKRDTESSGIKTLQRMDSRAEVDDSSPNRFSRSPRRRTTRLRTKSIHRGPAKTIDSVSSSSIGENKKNNELQGDGYMIVTRRSNTRKIQHDTLKSLTLEEQRSERERFLLDLRRWKVEPVPEFQYSSSSYNRVLLHIKEKLERQKEEKEWHRLRYTRLHMFYPLSNKPNPALDEDGLSLKDKSFASKVPIRRKKTSRSEGKEGNSTTLIPNQNSAPFPNQVAPEEVLAGNTPAPGNVAKLEESKKSLDFSKAIKVIEMAAKKKTRHIVNRAALGLVDEVDEDKDVVMAYSIVSEKIKDPIKENEDALDDEKKGDLQKGYLKLRVFFEISICLY